MPAVSESLQERAPVLQTTSRSIGAVRPGSSTWVKYYDRASRRRHGLGGYRRLRAEVKRRHRARKIAVAAAVVGMLALLAIFYAILSTA
jgi:hypothetical protein